MDMNRTMNPYAQPFFFEGTKDEAVLLIHGFTGTPAQMRPLGDALAAAGYAVRGILLPGHGTNLREMERTGWTDWLGAAEEALKDLLATYRKVDVIGFSMGGLIALNLAARFPVARFATISAPIRLQSMIAPLTPVLSLFRRYQPWNPEPRISGEVREPYTEGYPGFPVRCAGQLDTLRRKTLRRLADVKAPVLIAQSCMDSTVDLDSPYYLYDHVSSVYREVLLLERSRHNALLGPEREHLNADLIRFLDLPDETVLEASKHHVRKAEAAGAKAT